MQRAGATAATFGVSLEELAGNITAIGGTTQESGERIGTALRTIYSRITTLEPSKQILEELGIAMYEMGNSGPEIRDVSDILGDLSVKWADLTDEQRQNIGVTLAGRARLNQFMALMNNYGTSIEATNSAINSQGSAMREQQVYMESYQYQFEVLGANVSDLALTMEDELVGDAMYLFLSVASDMVSMLDTLIDRFGVLPTLLGGLGGIGTIFNLKGVGEKFNGFLKVINETSTGIGSLDRKFLSFAGNGVAKLTGSVLGLTGKFSALAGVLGGGVLIGGLMLVGKAIEHFVQKAAEARRANEEAERSFQNSMETLNNNGNNVNKLIDRYEELNTKLKQNTDSLNNEEQVEYNGLINELSTIMPEAVSHIDASGQVHLKNADAMRKSTERLQSLAAENAEYVKSLGNEKFDEHFEKLDDFRDRYQKNQKEIQGYKDALEGQAEILRQNSVNTEEYIQKMLAQSEVGENLRKAEAQNLSLKYELHGLQQQTLLMIGDEVNAYMGATGAYENVTSAGQALVSQYTQQKEAMIENMHLIEDEAERNKLKNEVYAESEKVSQAVSEAYNHLSENLNLVNTEGAIQEFDNLIQALPAEALEGDAEQVARVLEGLSDVVSDIMSGKNVDSKQLVRMLEEVGIGSNEARQTVERLGQEFNNQSINSAVAKEELTSYNDELLHTKELALETIDPLAQLFGVESGDMKSMESHLEYLKLMTDQYGKSAIEIDGTSESLEVLAQQFGVSEEWISQNLDQLNDAVLAFNSASIEVNEDTGKYFIKWGDDVSESTKKFVESLFDGQEGIINFRQSFVEEVGLIELSQKQLDEMTKELRDSFNKFYDAPSDDTDAWNSLLNTLKEQLETIHGSFVVIEDEVGNLKFQMADGSESEYLNLLNAQIGNSDLELKKVYNSATETFEVMAVDREGEMLSLAAISAHAESGAFALDNTTEAFNGLMNKATSEAEQETFISFLDTQVQGLGGEIELLEDETGNLKLAFTDGELSSPWLNSLNTVVEDLGLKLVETKDENNNLKIAIQNDAGETIYEFLANQANTAKEKVKETDKAVEEATTKERDDIDIDANTSKADEKIETTNSKIDAITRGGGVVPLDADGTEFHSKADEVENRTKNELEKESKKPLKLDIDEDAFNSVAKKVNQLDIDIRDLSSLTDDLSKKSQVVVENYEGLMTNTRNITDANNNLKNLNDTIDISIDKMGDLYQKFSSEQGIDTSGIKGVASTIDEEVGKVEEAVSRMRTAVNKLGNAMNSMNNKFNIVPLESYAVSVVTLGTTISAGMNNLSSSVINGVQGVNKANQILHGATQTTQGLLNDIERMYIDNEKDLRTITENMGIRVSNNYRTMSAKLVTITKELHKELENIFRVMKIMAEGSMESMGKGMVSEFRDTKSELKDVASEIPGDINRGIRDNMSKSTNSIGTLAKNLVKKFKQELGIHSPSRVFEGLGGDVIDGLVNGLSGRDITDLGQSVFSDFSDGAISTIEQIKGHMTFSPVTAGSFGNGFRMTSGFGPRRSPGGIGSTNHRGVDYAAPMGTPIPSQSSGRVVASGWMGGLGNAVIVESSRGIRHVYGHNSRNYVRVGQTVGKGQILGAVGSTGRSTGPHVHYEVRINGRAVDPRKRLRGFAEGGFVDKEELAFVGEEGLEAIIPLMPHRRERGLDLWTETGEILGMNSELLRMLINSHKRSGVFSSGGGFSGLDGEAGGGETATATSGTIAPDYSSIMRSLGTADQPMFSGMSSSEKPEALYRRDMHAINVGRFSSMLTKANTELSALMENTLKYRNALEEVNYQEKRLRDEKQKQLSASIKRQSQIEKELGKLRNTSKHTVDQRKKYNELQQEFDNNSESIMNLENEIRKMNISMDERKVKIYADYIGQLTKGFDDLTKAINKTTSDLKFSLDYLTLTDENNIGGQLKIQYDILRESIRLENTLMNNVNKLQDEYSRAVSRYGKDSQQALLAREELYSAESNYQSSVLNRVKLEQDVAKTREDVANEGIDTLKSYYKQTQTMTERAIELERKALEKHHENKMSMYDDEIAKIESVYDTRIAEMDAQEAEDAYNETISDLNTQRAELMQQISRASRDTSLEGRKRLAELQSQLGEVNSEIATTQKERQDQLYREAIERQKQEQIQAVEMQKERAEMEQEVRLESLDQQLADAQNYAERMINDEAMWEKLRNEFIAGNGTGLASMTNEMTEQMSRFMSGDFRAVSMGYSELSDEDRDLFSEETLLEISNLMLQSSESMERFVSTANERVQNIRNISGEDYSAGSITTGRTGNISTQAKASPTIPPAPKPAPKPKQDNRYYTIKRGDTLWDLAQKYYGNPYKWTTIAQANQNPDPRRLQIGRKLLIPFDTGGFTGDWIGNEGRIALLHKKELVLNESQTRDILDVAKIVDKISGFIPRISASRPNLGSGSVTNTGDNYNLETLVLEIPDFKGDEKDARRVFDNMAKSLKKLGK